MIENYISVFKKFATFTGRARRKEFWLFALGNFIAGFCLGFIGGLLNMPILSTIFALATILPGIAVAIRRMHDVNKSGWFCIVPIYGFILCCIEGDKGSNRFGPDPKAGASV